MITLVLTCRAEGDKEKEKKRKVMEFRPRESAFARWPDNSEVAVNALHIKHSHMIFFLVCVYVDDTPL